MARTKDDIEAELKELRREREQMDERISKVEVELDELLSLNEEAQEKYVNEKVKEFNDRRDRGGSPLVIGGQR